MTQLPTTIDDIVRHLGDHRERSAVIARTAEHRVSWKNQQFAEHVLRLAHGLRAHGLSRGDRVALLSSTSPEAMIAALATIVAGGIIVPLDTQFERDVLGDVLRDCDPQLLFTTSRYLQQVETSRGAGVELENIVLLDEASGQHDSWKSLLSEERQAPEPCKPDDYAVLFYTSGTTGPPKGVPLSHRNLALQLRALDHAELISEGDRVLLPLPMHHVYPFAIGILAPLTFQLPIVIPRSLTGPDVLQALREEEITVAIGVPRLYEALYEGIESRLEDVWQPVRFLFHSLLKCVVWLQEKWGLPVGGLLFRPIRKRIAPSLRLLTCGGSPIDPDLLRKLTALGWQVGVGYGLTETSPLLTLKKPGAGPADSVGKPIEATELRLDASAVTRDCDTGETPAQRGEILARGPGVFREYWNRPEKTAAAIAEDGWFRTGDIGGFDDDGFLHVTGRVSTMIVTESGENIQPDDVEEAICEAPAIAEAGVLQHDNKLVAVVVPDEREWNRRRDEQIGIEQLIRDALNEQSRRLPSYQRISEFRVSTKSLPRTRLGKIRRHKLETLYHDLGEQETGEMTSEPIAVEEMSPEDRELVSDERVDAVWKYLSERFHDRSLSPDSSLQLDLGVDSMEWINLTIEIRDRTGISLDDEAIRNIRSVRDLLQTVHDSARDDRQSPEWLDNPESMLSDKQLRWVKPLGPVARLVPRCGYGVNRAIQKLFFRLEAEGGENLPAEPPFVIAANHVSSLDPFSIAAALKPENLRQTYWAAWKGKAFDNALARLFSRYARAVPIDPERGPVASLAVAAAVLQKRQILVWFPEGERSHDGTLQPLRPGLGLLLQHDGIPVVPAWIDGTYDALPRGRFFPRFKKT